jgi:hypothetical protein
MMAAAAWARCKVMNAMRAKRAAQHGMGMSGGGGEQVEMLSCRCDSQRVTHVGHRGRPHRRHHHQRLRLQLRLRHQTA